MNEEQKSLFLKSSFHFPPPSGEFHHHHHHLLTPISKKRRRFLSLTSYFAFLFSGVKLSYGTAGFRADASILQSTVYRVGILAALRSLKTQSVIGLMITASHNKVTDNGVKIADPSGGMLSQDWEPFSDQLANAPDPQSLVLVSCS